MSRRWLVTVVALATAVALSACGGDDGGSAESSQQTIESATLAGIESGELDLTLTVDVPGEEGGDLDLSLSGPFQGGAGGDLPKLDLDASAQGSVAGEEIDFEGGLILLSNTAYVNYEGVEYEVDPTTFGFVQASLEQAEGDRPGQAGNVGCEEAVAGLRVGELLDGLGEAESAEVEGVDVTKVSGDLDVGGALDALLNVVEAPACRAQVAAAGELPSRKEVEEAKDEVEAGLKDARVEVYVGEDDIVRRVSADLDVEPRRRSETGPRRAAVQFDLTLSGVNEEQEISAPEEARPLNDLFLKLNINPIELLGLLEGGRLGELLEDVGDAAARAGSGGANQQRYVRCLGEATTPVDLQRCMRLSG